MGPTYFAKATATSTKIANFLIKPSTVVTASASATATSTQSPEDANKLAQDIAQQIADSNVENYVNIMVQAVNISTMVEPNFGLE